jgi:hypothetical protein
MNPVRAASGCIKTENFVVTLELVSRTDTQIFTIVLATVPNVLAVLMGILINNSRLNDLRAHMDARFDDMRNTWRTELHRVEEVIDARLKHLEER